MNLEPVSRPTVTFVAVSERTSELWFAVLLGFLGSPLWAFAIWFVLRLFGHEAGQ